MSATTTPRLVLDTVDISGVSYAVGQGNRQVCHGVNFHLEYFGRYIWIVHVLYGLDIEEWELAELVGWVYGAEQEQEA